MQIGKKKSSVTSSCDQFYLCYRFPYNMIPTDQSGLETAIQIHNYVNKKPNTSLLLCNTSK